MKSIAEQYVAARDARLSEGYTEVQLTEAIKEAVNEENRLSIMLALGKKKPVAESKKIVRNNGRGTVEMTESDKNAERVNRVMREHKCSFREASIICGLPDPGKNAKENDTVVVERAARWKKYGGAYMTDADARKLAEKGIEP